VTEYTDPGINPDGGGQLYRYTTPVGAEGIISSGKVRATDFAFLNHTQEFSLDSTELSEFSTALGTRAPPDHHHSDLKANSMRLPVLAVACFSSEADVPSQ
jgi:hypothetical protein